MKTHFKIIFCCIQITLLVALNIASGQEGMTNYQRLVHLLFDKSATCQIHGEFVWRGDVHKIKFTADTKEQVDRLKKCFLAEDPEFIGLIDPDNKPVSMYASYLDFKWLSKEKKEIGHSIIIDGDTLIFNDKHIYKTKDQTFLVSAAGIALPEIFRRPPQNK